jgi:hypothetical protein
MEGIPTFCVILERIELNNIFGVIITLSFFMLIPLAFLKTFTHFKYRKLKRGEKSRGLLNPFYFSPYMILDWFSTVWIYPIIKRNEDEELEKMRRSINRIVYAIYSCIILIIVCFLTIHNFK